MYFAQFNNDLKESHLPGENRNKTIDSLIRKRYQAVLDDVETSENKERDL